MQLEKLAELLDSQPKFRIKQINKLIYQDLISDWQEASVLPLALRQNLNKFCPLTIEAQIFATKKSPTKKALLTLADGKNIETVLLSHLDGRHTVCVSSQVGCPMACKFCATGQLGFDRNLKPLEIVEQVIFWARQLKKTKARVTNVVYMGMGEPFMNYNNVLESIRILNDLDKFALGARHISISTCGIIEGINKLAKENLQVNLAISLHAPNNELRTKLMPINKKYPLDKVLAAVKKYVKNTSRRVMFEYLLLDKVNDSFQQAEQLARLMSKPLYMVNIINYNQTGVFRSAKSSQIKDFINILRQRDVAVTQRYTFGADIWAACGQLANKKK